VSRSDRILVAAGGAAVILAGVAVFILLAPTGAPGTAQPTADLGAGVLVDATAPAIPATSGQPPPSSGTIFVDVEGAVAEPGIRELPAGSRVADAIAAAGGYATDADLEASAAAINLAQLLNDGEQVRVPRIGEAEQTAPSPEPATAGSGTDTGSGGGGTAGGLVNLNTATPEELEALPGIGAVTVQKIVAAREERPFSSLQDAVDRGVIHRGQLEDIQGVATAG
jgi:competence protein ComEA